MNVKKLEKAVKMLEKSIHTESVDDYIKLPKNERTSYGFWYRPIASFKFDHCDIWSEPDKYYGFLKKEFPIQYFFRKFLTSKIDRITRKIKDIYWYKIRPIFKPQHSRLRRVIPRTWSDISSLIPAFLFECLKSYKEEESDNICWEGKVFYTDLLRWYNYITVERIDLIKQIDNSYPEIGAKGSYNELYGKLSELEEQLAGQDTKCLTWIIENREVFWS